MSRIFLLLCLTCAFAVSKAQTNYIKLDYQYLRSDDLYVGYTLSLDTLNKKVAVEFVVNKNIREVKQIAILADSSQAPIDFVEDSSKPSIDDKRIRAFRLLTNILSYPSKNTCDATIRFTISKKTYYDLPINLCLLH